MTFNFFLSARGKIFKSLRRADHSQARKEYRDTADRQHAPDICMPNENCSYKPFLSWLGLLPVDCCTKRENDAADEYPSLIPISLTETSG